MNMPPIVSPQEWEAAREELLVKEKELTRARDALAARAPPDAEDGRGEGLLASMARTARRACSTCSRGAGS